MVMDYAKSIGFEVLNLDYSPIKGPEGNIEYLLHIRKTTQDESSSAEQLSSMEQLSSVEQLNEQDRELIAKIVDMAHGELD